MAADMLFEDNRYGWTACSWYSKAAGGFSPPPIHTPVLLLRASSLTAGLERLSQVDPALRTADFGWGNYCTQLTSRSLPGNHLTLVMDPQASSLAHPLEEWLA